MNTDRFFKKIIQRLKSAMRASQTMSSKPQPDEAMGKLLRMVQNTDEVEIGCDEVLELLDQYVEAEARGEDVADLFPMLQRHLDRCRDCHEEYEALVRVFEATSR